MTSWSATPMGSMTPVGLGMLHIRAAADWFNWRKVNLLFLNCALGGGGGERHFCKSSSLWGIFNKVLFVCSYSLLCVLLICDWLIDCFAWDFCSVFYWFLIDWLIVLQEILVLCIIDLWLIDCFAGYFCSVFYWFVIDWLIVLQEIFVLCFIDLWLTDWLFCRRFCSVFYWFVIDWLIDCCAGNFCSVFYWFVINWLIVLQEILFCVLLICDWLIDWLLCRRWGEGQQDGLCRHESPHDQLVLLQRLQRLQTLEGNVKHFLTEICSADIQGKIEKKKKSIQNCFDGNVSPA